MLDEEELTFKTRGCVFEVFRELGAGFTEKVYEKALLLELKSQGLEFKEQQLLKVHDKKQVVGEYVTDIVVENKVVLELKAINKITSIH